MAHSSRCTQVLFVDDDETLGAFLQNAVRKSGLEMAVCHSGQEALSHLASNDVDVVVADVNMRGLDGLALAEKLLAMKSDLPVILITGSSTMDSAIAAVRLGAHDYLLKPIEAERLVLSVERARQMRQLSTEVKRLQTLVQAAPGEIVGQSKAMQQLLDLIARVAPSDAAVLIRGESGTGKELVARALHAHSARASGPFVAINCAAMPAALLESELFGHVKGAFTDARGERRGLFLEADGGTLFLDEVGEMALEMQAKLLRALQEHTVRPVGGGIEVPFTARLITATNRDLETEVHEKRFREDLYYRIHVVRVDVPPLRSREGDVLLLAQHFLARAAQSNGKAIKGFSTAAAEKLSTYEWPGNVRELENCIQGAVAMARFDEIGVEDLPERIRTFLSKRVMLSADTPEELITLEQLERRYLSRVLSLVNGNKTRAAEILGVNRRTLYRMLDRQEPLS